MSAPQPTFRGLPQAEAAARILASAMAAQVSVELALPAQASREPKPVAGLGRPEVAAA
jgi:hypothetical protein